MSDSSIMPMFPLGSVLFPSMILPLRIFEPRYRALARHCVDTETGFGVVLIERGSEVGGGDVRSTLGCLASVVQHEEQPDGQWFMVCVGTSRIRVLEWFDDDPYPRALVEDWNDPEPPPDLAAQVSIIEQPFRTALALSAELGGRSAPITIELSEDPVLATYQISALSPLGPLDRQHLLGAPDASTRVAMLSAMLTDTLDDLRAQLGSS